MIDTSATPAEPTTTEPAAAIPTPAKVDPETLVLRGRPGRVVRFRRGVIITAAALGTTAIAGVAWIALKPAAFHIAAGDDRGELGANAAPEALANAPRSYGDVPRLGPPLPGDLGKPILDRQRELVAPVAPPAGVDQAAQAAEAERQRIAADRKAARESGVMMQLAAGRTTSEAASPAPGAPGSSAPAAAPKLALDPGHDPNGQQRKADFVSARDTGGDINPHALAPSPSPYTLTAGTVIAAGLITGVNSDLPGLVTAQVTQNVYDSVTGRTLLLPQGSRMIGSYDSVVAFGQRRALVVWQRIVLPDGSSIRIDNVPATDTAGYAGLSDKVDVHTWQLLKGVVLTTLLGVGSELSFGSNEADPVRALRESTQQSGSRAGDQLVMRNLNLQPTVRVRPGWPLRMVVNKDLVLAPWRGGER